MKCVFHLADFDGICSAAIIKYKYPNCELIPYDYGRQFPWDKFTNPDEDVFMVDISLPIAEPLCGLDMMELDRRSMLTWIDHHKTAIEDAEKMEFNPEGIRQVGKAACELTWEYFFPDKKIPETVYLLGRYDVWDHRDKPKVMLFQYGMKVQNTNPSNQSFWSTLFGERGIQRDNFVESIIRDGRLVLEYAKQQDKKYSTGFSFETEIAGYKAIAINRGMANSHLFEHVWDNKKYDLMIAFCMKKSDNGKYIWQCSLYTDKPDIDVGIIAKAFGEKYKTSGGGHSAASGFLALDLSFLSREFLSLDL